MTHDLDDCCVRVPLKLLTLWNDSSITTSTDVRLSLVFDCLILFHAQKMAIKKLPLTERAKLKHNFVVISIIRCSWVSCLLI